MKTENLNSDQADVMGCKKGAAVKVLNLYAGIGGNRKLWTDCEVTAVEFDEKIANIYRELYPNDTVIVGDAHQYLLDHYSEFDFIWASPPCPTHSRMVRTNLPQGMKLEYPDMRLYQEIIILKTWFKGKYCVENVISYYDPLIPPTESSSHYFWTNFVFTKLPNEKRGIERQNMDFRQAKIGIDLSKWELTDIFKKKILNNCTEPEIGLHIFNCARNILVNRNEKQTQLF